MKPIRTFKVAPSLPASIEALTDVAHNLWLCWNHPAIELFRRLDGDLWEATGHNPVLRAREQLAPLSPQDDVSVELYAGRVDADGQLVQAKPVAMHLVGPDADGAYLFETAAAVWHGSGLNGYTVRVLPSHPDVSMPFQPGLIAWASPNSNPSQLARANIPEGATP